MSRLVARMRLARARRAAYRAERRKKALVEGTLSHGKRGTFDAGCRCWKCVEARRVAYFTKPSEYGYQRIKRINGGA